MTDVINWTEIESRSGHTFPPAKRDEIERFFLATDLIQRWASAREQVLEKMLAGDEGSAKKREAKVGEIRGLVMAAIRNGAL